MTIELYDTKDVKIVRCKFIEEQDNRCALTGLEIPEGQAVLDHDHSTQLVRGVLHRQANAVLGKIENLWKRYLAWWYEGDLISFLRKSADYLEKEKDTRYYHPGWKKRVLTDFNKLSSAEKTRVLNVLNPGTKYKNDAERKQAFNKVLLTRKYGFDRIRTVLTDSTTNPEGNT